MMCESLLKWYISSQDKMRKDLKIKFSFTLNTANEWKG